MKVSGYFCDKIISRMRQRGFTIVELLIVIVVIGILAAITIVVYNGIQKRGNDAAVQADLNSFGKIMEIQKADLGTYPTTFASSMGLKFSKDAYGEDSQGRNVRYCYDSSNDRYVLVVNSKSGNFFKLINGVVSSTPNTSWGFAACALIGLSSTNPIRNGYDRDLVPQWAAWTN